MNCCLFQTSLWYSSDQICQVIRYESSKQIIFVESIFRLDNKTLIPWFLGEQSISSPLTSGQQFSCSLEAIVYTVHWHWVKKSRVRPKTQNNQRNSHAWFPSPVRWFAMVVQFHCSLIQISECFKVYHQTLKVGLKTSLMPN